METVIFAGVAATVVAFLGLALRLAPDTRDTLRGKEEELASYGITWSTDPNADHALAAEFLAARRRRGDQPAVGALGPAIGRGLAGTPLRAGSATLMR